ncbi:MAG: IclR family transcriptional regulator [Comamonadaceae bacterium]|nr:MAG: IclR family transcriptional regulator [Comamonadaceae bacterium]
MSLDEITHVDACGDTLCKTGTQSLTRGIDLMKMIATRPQFGWRLSDLAAACNQPRATVHRMLTCLVEQRLVSQRDGDRHYLPGPLMFELGLALPEYAGFQQAAHTLVKSFARRMAGIALFQLRSGNDYVCSLRAGSVSLTGLMVTVGTRRPLFTSAGGVAILQTLPDEEVRQILLHNVAHEIERHGTGRLAALQKMRERSNRHGFGVNFGDVVKGSYAFGAPVRDSAGKAFGALLLIGTEELYPPDRLEELRGELMAQAALLEEEARRFGV